MTYRNTIMKSVAASGIVLAVSAFLPSYLPLATPAYAQTNISVNFGFGTFYDRLQPFGSWVSYEDRYVFVPQHVGPNWRPYTLGHWSYTHQYGWLWVSDERFGWATYHYGRWGYSRDIGWYWVPGHRWAPAWVAWSRGHNEVAWAPLPPRRNNDVEVNITIGDVPDYYWQAVPTSAFLSINLSDKVIRDRNQIRTIVQQSPPETVRIENNIVVNNVIQVNEIEKATNAKVPVLVAEPVNDPNAVGKTQGSSVTIFNPEVVVDTTAKPKQAVKVEEVVTARKAEGIQPADVPTDQPAATTPVLDKNGKPVNPADQPAAAAPTLDKNGKPIVPADQSAVKAQGSTDGKATTDAPAIVNQDSNATVTAKPADPSAPKVEAQGKVDSQGKAEVPKTQDATKNGQKTMDQNTTTPADTQSPPADGKQVQVPAKKDEKAKVKCDPKVETCPPAQ